MCKYPVEIPAQIVAGKATVSEVSLWCHSTTGVLRRTETNLRIVCFSRACQCCILAIPVARGVFRTDSPP